MTKKGETQKPWTEQEDADLKTMWMAGKLTITIALAMNRTESGVNTRVARLGLGRKPKIKGSDLQETAAGMRVKPTRLSSIIANTAYGEPVSLANITSNLCHWPIDGHRQYCGGSGVNKPYGLCPEHFKIAWQGKSK